MNYPSPDRRARNTRNAIHASLYQLSQVKDLSKITVKDLCTLAEINRSTFYKHYESLQLLKDEISEEKAQKLIDEYERIFHATHSFLEVTTGVFQVLKDDPDIYRWVLCDRASHGHQYLYHYLEDSFIPRWINLYPSIPRTQISWIFTFLIEGSLAVYKKYCESNYPEDIDSINHTLMRLAEKGISSFT